MNLLTGLGLLVFAVLLGLYVFRFSQKLYGTKAGIFALLLYTLGIRMLISLF